jgi:hypothetical protein
VGENLGQAHGGTLAIQSILNWYQAKHKMVQRLSPSGDREIIRA